MGNRNSRHKTNGRMSKLTNTEKRKSKILSRKETEDQRKLDKSNSVLSGPSIESIFSGRNLLWVNLVNKLGLVQARKYMDDLDAASAKREEQKAIEDNNETAESDIVDSDTEPLLVEA